MRWKRYECEFQKRAKNVGKCDEYINGWLAYAKKLYEQGLPIIYSVDHFSKLVGYSTDYIYSISNSSKHFYRTFFIAKKDGTKRQIDEPLPGLKNIQRWILDEILNKLSVSKYAKAYVKKRSVRSNAYYHRNRKCIIALDIKEYFASIHYSKVFSFFLSLGYTEHVACVLSNICLLNNALPQGAPTSPALSNLCTKDLDDDLSAFVKGKQIMCTRYADDIAFSGNFIDIREFYKNVKRILNKHGFRLNYAKTRVLHKHQRQLVTGIVVNEKMQVSKDVRHMIRQSIYYIKKFGLQEHARHIGENEDKYYKHLLGMVGFALFINPKDEQLKAAMEHLKNIKHNIIIV